MYPFLSLHSFTHPLFAELRDLAGGRRCARAAETEVRKKRLLPHQQPLLGREMGEQVVLE